MSALAAPPSPGSHAPPVYGPAPRVRVLRWALAPLFGGAVAALIALALVASAFVADGGLRLEATTRVSTAWIVGSGILVAAAILRGRRAATPRKLHGAALIAAMGLLTVVTAASIAWSVSPSTSWEEANRTAGYLAVTIAGVVLARLAPRRWASVVQGVAAASVIVCGWALLTRILPAALSPDETFARLRDPFGYWNAVGGMAALGMPALVWLAARRDGHAAVNAVAWPSMAVLLVAMMLSYSRGALLALAVGLAFWFLVTPLRLRGALALIVAILGAAVPVVWAFSQQALTLERVPLEVRADAGRELGLLMLLVIVVLLGIGLAASFAAARRPLAPSTRQRLGRTLMIALAVIPVLAVMALSQAPGGISGQVSKAVKQLTDPVASTPGNTPDRLRETSSVRARYWREALAIHAQSPWIGVGAGGYVVARSRVRQPPPVEVRHAHGYVVQTLSDLGWAGLAASLLVLAASVAAAVRAIGLRARERRLPWDAERVGMATLATVGIVYAVHSALDFTWVIPGLTNTALLSLGWLAGASPLAARLTARLPASAPTRATAPAHVLAAESLLATHRRRWRPTWRPVGALGALVITGAVAWSSVQPLRAANTSDAAIARADAGDLDDAAVIATEATRRNPLSVDALWDLAAIEMERDRTPAARAAFERAVQLEPANAETWRRLGRLRLAIDQDPQGALTAFRAAFYLDPQSLVSVSDLLEARRAVMAQRGS